MSCSYIVACRLAVLPMCTMHHCWSIVISCIVSQLNSPQSIIRGWYIDVDPWQLHVCKRLKLYIIINMVCMVTCSYSSSIFFFIDTYMLRHGCVNHGDLCWKHLMLLPKFDAVSSINSQWKYFSVILCSSFFNTLWSLFILMFYLFRAHYICSFFFLLDGKNPAEEMSECVVSSYSV